MCSFAIYRLPYAHEATLVQQTEGEPAEYFSYKELNGRSGFVVAPFEVTPQQPILLIQGESEVVLLEEGGKRKEERDISYHATVEAMHGITSALVTTTLVFMAVFVPVCFIGGVTGTFYTQFGLTMAIAVAISLFNALTLSPALCALIMRSKPTEPAAKHFSHLSPLTSHLSYKGFVRAYKQGLSKILRKQWLAFSLVVVAIGGLYWMMRTTKTAMNTSVVVTNADVMPCIASTVA